MPDDQGNTPGLCAGQGKFFTLTKPKNYPEMTGYRTMTWLDILWLAANPQNVHKHAAWWVIPSSLTHRYARLKSKQECDGQFWIVWGDLDDGNLDLSAVFEGLYEVLDPGTESLIYASKSSTPDNKKWRTMVRLKGPCPGTHYHIFAATFNAALGHVLGVKVDEVANRLQQPAFMPNMGEHYEWLHTPGAAMGDTASTQRSEAVSASVVRQYNSSPERRLNGKRNVVRQKERGYYLDKFALKFSVETLLERYGFVTQNGVDWHHPDLQTTGSYGTSIMDDGTWTTSSQSVAAKLGRAGGDSFDLYVALGRNGDWDGAYRDLVMAVKGGTDVDTKPPELPRPFPIQGFYCDGKFVEVGHG